ncbi:MAG: hypothetical protein KME65_07695 [Candidatus Thiodiazotropha sp. (ex Ctena orbiculata)]|uniref:Chromosome partition protein Smc n=1 Tax=Candidatus Thiodiazotropha taylori TaxID=2792791 RepID=A0A944QUE1_9GAMM|nr:hypothetical protein [Candidatus Thiodiazotropha taylori]
MHRVKRALLAALAAWSLLGSYAVVAEVKAVRDARLGATDGRQNVAQDQSDGDAREVAELAPYAELDSLRGELSSLRLRYKELEQRLSNNGQGFAKDIGDVRRSVDSAFVQVKKLAKRYSELASKLDRTHEKVSETERLILEELRGNEALAAQARKLIETDVSRMQEKLDELSAALADEGMARADLAAKIEGQIARTSALESRLDALQDRTYWYWVVSIALMAAFLIIAGKLHEKQRGLRQEMMREIEGLDGSMKEDRVRFDEKLLELIDAQIVKAAVTTEEDHTLALKVADEIVRIQKNISRMDEGTKGLKQLAASVVRIQDNFAANGYEIVDMLEKPYVEGMRATVNYVSDENLDEGQQIISRIIKPQVNYQGVMIQSAQIEVSTGE